MAGVIARSHELEAIESFLAAAAEGPAALVLAGEPGIGKTTLIRAGTDGARERGNLVLSCAPSAPERRLAYAALGDVLGELDTEVGERLPPPQRQALDAALLRSAPDDGGVDRRAVATAVLSVLESLAADSPVVVAIDDLQWIDRDSARVVEFCGRRLKGPVGMLASRRTGDEGAWARGLVKLRDPSRAHEYEIQPLDSGELAGLLRAHTERPLERRALARIHETSGGNPFYALELVRGLPDEGPLPSVLPLPESLEEIVGARLEGLGAKVEDALLAAAALADPTLELIERAAGQDAAGLLEAAEARGVIELHGSRVRFTHPLLANGVYTRATAGRRRAMHRQFGGIVSGAEERARHLVLGGGGKEAIDALAVAARGVRSRGAPDTAAELLELALDQEWDATIAAQAAEHHFDAGDPRRARALLEEAITGLDSGESRARALLQLAEVRNKDDSIQDARDLLARARGEAGDDSRLLAMIELRFSWALFNLGLLPEAAAPAQRAVAYAEKIGDPALRSQALAAAVMIDFNLGLGVDERRLAEALELEGPGGGVGWEFRGSLVAGLIFLWTGQLDRSEAALDTFERRLGDLGDEHALSWQAVIRVWLECWSGNLERARMAADAAMEPLALLGTTAGRAFAAFARVAVDAHAGHVEETRRGCDEAVDLLEQAGWRHTMAWPLMMRGYLELSAGNPAEALAAIEDLASMAISIEMPEPVAAGILVCGDAAEAYVALGRLDEAEELVSLLERRGAQLDRAWAIAVGARCRGLLLAARGDVAGAERALERALEAHERLGMPLERGRSLLALGRIRRRLKRRRDAKSALDEALGIFEAAGSPLWAEQVRSEIDCLGLRPTTEGGLTPSEQRVAALAAEGHTNREVAAALGISQKTVEAHLARIYRKLEIHSRAELGGRMAQGTAAEDLAPRS